MGGWVLSWGGGYNLRRILFCMPLTLASHQYLPLDFSSNPICQQLRGQEMGKFGEFKDTCLLLNKFWWRSKENGKSGATLLLTNPDQEWRDTGLSTEWRIKNADKKKAADELSWLKQWECGTTTIIHLNREMEEWKTPVQNGPITSSVWRLKPESRDQDRNPNIQEENHPKGKRKDHVLSC